MSVEPARVVLQLAAALERRLVADGVRGVQVLALDRDRAGGYRRRAGLEVGRDRAVRAHYGAAPIPALLLVGMHEGSCAERPALAALLEWPGLVQLAYGAAWAEFRAAGARAAEGASSPLPQAVLAPVEDILRLSSEVRHWLRNRLRNGEAAVNILERFTRGEIRLHPSNLKPVAPISREHRDVLERLWAHERPARELAPRTGGVAGLKDALDTFTARWDEIEAARASLRDAVGASALDAAGRLLLRHRRACDALRHAIAMSVALDEELKVAREN